MLPKAECKLRALAGVTGTRRNARRAAPARCGAAALVLLSLGCGGAGAQTIDDLFDEIPAEDAPAAAEETKEQTGLDALFDDPAAAQAQGPLDAIRFSGFVQNELGYIYSGDEHFNKFRTVAKLKFEGTFNGLRWHAGGHMVYNPVFAFEDFFPDRVEENYDFYGWLDETYIDTGVGNWEFRLGRQHIIWGEVVGLFFADVVSALDLREFILPDFDLIRIPQWAARAEYFAGDYYLDFIYVPVVTADQIGEPGGDYYGFPPPPPQPGVVPVYLDADEPDLELGSGGVGVRGAYIKDGWDLAAFFYSSIDHSAAFERTVTSGPGPLATATYRPNHERIHQFGATLAKDFGDFVLKSEAVYTLDRRYAVQDLADADGLSEQNELRYTIGLDYVRGEHTFNAQFFQFYLPDRVPTMVPDKLESGITLFATTQALHPDVTPEVLWIRSLNREEWLLQAKVTWQFEQNWRAVAGVDVFEGPLLSLFGQFDRSDRVYYELRYSF